MAHQVERPLDAVLVGVARDELEELYEILRDRGVKPAFLAKRLTEYKKAIEADRLVRPFIQASRAVSIKRQRLRQRLAKILDETISFYETELARAKKAGVLEQEQSGYRATRALLAALDDRHDSIIGPEMGFGPKRTRGPRERPEQARLRNWLKLLKLSDQATFILNGVFPAKRKK